MENYMDNRGNSRAKSASNGGNLKRKASFVIDQEALEASKGDEYRIKTRKSSQQFNCGELLSKDAVKKLKKLEYEDGNQMPYGNGNVKIEISSSNNSSQNTQGSYSKIEHQNSLGIPDNLNGSLNNGNSSKNLIPRRKSSKICENDIFSEVETEKLLKAPNSATQTLSSIVSDNQSGIPSLNQEKAKQTRIFRMKLKKNLKKELKIQSQMNQEQIPETNQSRIQELKQEEQKLNSLAPSQKITSSSFSGRNHTQKWSSQETLQFFKSLEFFGTDFSLISQIFPTRNRLQIKNQFRKEERENSNQIQIAMNVHQTLRTKRIEKKIKQAQAILNCQNIPLQQRIAMLNLRRQQRRESFQSVDSMDIIINEELHDICEKIR